MSQNDREFERRARALYLRASRDVDPVIAGRLLAARRTAVARPPEPLAKRLLLPAGAFAVLAMATLVLFQPSTTAPSSPSVNQSADADSADLPPDADSADPNLYKDLDFYHWLAYNETTSSSR